MSSRRSILAAAVAMAGAGCSSSGESDVDPSTHVPDDWHEEPQQGLADPLTMNARKLSEHPKRECPSLAAGTAANVLEDRLRNPTNVSAGEVSSEVDGHDRAIVWVRRVTLSRDGEVVSSPSIEFQTLREAAPRTIKAPDESDYGCQLPIFVLDRMTQLL